MHGDDEIPGLVVEPGGDGVPTEMEKRLGIRHYRVRDERAGSPRPPRRQQHSFPDLERTEWGKKWGKEIYERLDKLRDTSLRHIARPLEVGKLPTRQRIYILSDYYEHTLEIGDSGLANDPKRSRAWKLFAQIVEAVDSLHQVDLPHGALCPQKIGVDEATDTAWICGTAWAPLGHWTGGDYVDTDARPYIAPENRSKSSAPSEQADLYALGRIGIEMVAGRQDGTANPNEETDFTQALTAAGIDRPRRKLLLSLTSADPEKRPASAREVMRRLRRAEGARIRLVLRVGSCALALVLSLLACLVPLYVSIRREAVQLNGKLNAAEQKSADGEKQLVDMRTRLEQQQSTNGALKSALEDAKKEIERLKAGHVDPRTKSETDRKAGEEATRLWQEYAGKRGLTFENLRHVFQDDDSLFLVDELIREKARTKLRSLLAEFDRRNGGPWQLRFIPPKCEEGKPCVRRVQIYVDGTLVDGGDLDLRSATEPVKVPIDWRTDQPIRIVLFDLLQSVGRTWRTGYLWSESAKWTVMDGGELEFRGPVALWQLKKRTLQSGTDGPAIEIEILDCPGQLPRRPIDQAAEHTAHSLLGTKQTDAQEKQTDETKP